MFRTISFEVSATSNESVVALLFDDSRLILDIADLGESESEREERREGKRNCASGGKVIPLFPSSVAALAPTHFALSLLATSTFYELSV